MSITLSSKFVCRRIFDARQHDQIAPAAHALPDRTGQGMRYRRAERENESAIGKVIIQGHQRVRTTRVGAWRGSVKKRHHRVVEQRPVLRIAERTDARDLDVTCVSDQPRDLKPALARQDPIEFTGNNERSLLHHRFLPMRWRKRTGLAGRSRPQSAGLSANPG